MIAGKFKRYIKGAGLTAAAAVGLFLFAGTSNAQYGGYGYPQPNYGGYGNYGGYNNGRYGSNDRRRIEKAYEKGVKEGRKQGERDAKNGYRSNRNYGGYNNRGGSILGAIFGGGYSNRNYSSGQEQQAYNSGYQRGYQEGYDRYYRSNNRGWGNRRSTWPF